MKRNLLFIIFAIVIATPAMAADLLQGFITDADNIITNMTPKDFSEKISVNDRVLFLGKIDDVIVYVNDYNETVIEYLCSHLTLSTQSQTELKTPVLVSDQKSGSFSFVVKAPLMSPSQINDLSVAINASAGVAFIVGRPYGKELDSGITTVYIENEKVIVGDMSFIEFAE